MRFGSLFSGIGGLDLGLERAGMQCVWQVEIDDYCQRVLAKHWPDVAKFGDIRDCGVHNLEPVDLICGGFPCQPFSFAGKRRGKAGDRYLWPEMFRVIEEMQPSFIIVENVTGIKGDELETVCSDLEHQGYEVSPLDLSAAACGLQTLERHIWVIAARRGIFLERGGQDRVQKFSSMESFISEQRTPCNGDQGITLGPDLPDSRLLRSRKGVPYFLDRIRGIGNAVPPQCAEFIGRIILQL